MSKTNVVELKNRASVQHPLTEMLRVGAQKLIQQQAVESELQELLAGYSERRTEDDNAGVVRNGYLSTRELQTGMGPVNRRIKIAGPVSGKPESTVA